jgi:signal transduction histidine kinase/ActR/RegA family two-component response regulator
MFKPMLGRFFSVSHSVIISFILLNALTWGAVWSEIQIAREYEYADVANDTKAAAAIFGEQATRVIRSIDSTLQSAAYLTDLDPKPNRVKQLVEANALSMDYLVLLTFVDSKARTIGTNAGPDPNFTNLADREHIRVHLERTVEGLFIGKPVVGRVSGKWSIQLTRLINKPDGTICGVVVGSLDPFYFSRFWRSVEDDSEIVLTLVGPGGTVLTSSHETERKLAQGAADESVLHIIRDTAGSGMPLRNNEGIGAVVPIAQTPLHAVAQVSQAAFEKRVDRINRNYISVGLALSLIVNASVFFSARSLSVAQTHEEAARKAQERLQQAVESMNDGFVLYDEKDRLIISNAAYRSTFPEIRDFIAPGRSFSEIIGKIREIYGTSQETPEYRGWVEERLRRASMAYEPFECKYPNGRWIRIYDRRTPDGGAVGIRTDLSDLKRREEDLLASQAMLAQQAEELRKLADFAQQADWAKSSFVAAVSHELRTPLNAILGFSNQLQETKLDEEQLHFVQTLQASARHLAQIVNDILDLTRLEAGHLEIHPVLFQLKELVTTLRDMSRPLIGDRLIEFDVLVCSDVPETFLGDLRRITQILINLVGNAVKFTDAGKVQLRICLESRQQDVCRVSFAITDTGRGISPEAMSHLFAPFQQGDVTENLRASGTGLGLVISRGLAHLMKGELTVVSEVGRGSTFALTIPLGVREQGKLSGPPVLRQVQPVAKPTTSLQILVADDAEASRMLCGFLLQKRGHRTTLVENGEKAVQAARETHYDLILMDVEMPGMGGREAVEAIRRGPSMSSNSHIVALTAQAFEHQLQAMITAGCNEVLTKPFETQDMESLLSRLKQE